jgi:hypothetical protein
VTVSTDLSLHSRIRDALALSWSDSTKQTYGTGLLVYHVYCDSLNLSETQRAPASRDVMSSFVASLVGMYAQPTISSYVAGVHAWHTLHRIDYNVNDDELSTLLQAA